MNEVNEQRLRAWLTKATDPKHSDGEGLAQIPQVVPDEYISDGESLDEIIEILESIFEPVPVVSSLVFMLDIPYEGLLEPAFTTREEAEKHWAGLLNFGNKVIEVKVHTSAEEADE